MFGKCTPVCEERGNRKLLARTSRPKKRSSRTAGGTGEEASRVLENDLQRKLRSAWSPTSEERIADAYIACGGKAQWTETTAWRRARYGAYTCARRIGNEVRQIWVCEIRMIEDVEKLGSEL